MMPAWSWCTRGRRRRGEPVRAAQPGLRRRGWPTPAARALDLGTVKAFVEASNSLIESVNAKIRLITRIAFGFKNVAALIALAMLNLGGHRPALPGRN